METQQIEAMGAGPSIDGSDPQSHYWKYTLNRGWEGVSARVIGESPVTLTVNGQDWLTFLCTPSDLEALAIGFLYNEGIIRSVQEISRVYVCKQKTDIEVWLPRVVERPRKWIRTSGCTGGLTALSEVDLLPKAVDTEAIGPDQLLLAFEQLLAAQELYREARGIHCSALSDGISVRYQAEDIGRHNTIDKLAGKLLLDPLELPRKIILTTGRISSEMLQKSARVGASIVLSRTSPTTLSIRLADQLGITLVGYARRNQFNVYTHPWRLQG